MAQYLENNEINQTISLLKSDKRFANIEIKYSSTNKQPFKNESQA